jgi:transposase
MARRESHKKRCTHDQPDFANVKSLLEEACEKRGFQVLFLPKFHCELNFLEQCWSYVKRIYREYPPSTKEEALEKNALSALEAVLLVVMRRSVPSHTPSS